MKRHTLTIFSPPYWQTADFAQRVLQISQQLKQDNIQAVGLWVENATQFAAALLACLHAKVTVLLPPNLLTENQQWLVNNSALPLDDNALTHYGKLQKIEPFPPLIDTLIDKQNNSQIWLKTSGSSGHAKIIKKTAQQMWQEAHTLANTLPFERNAPIHLIGSVSLQHLYGLTFRLFLPLEMGWHLGEAQLHYPEYLVAESKHHRTLWISSPALLTHLNLPALEPDLHIDGIISSGGALPDVTASQLRQHFPCPIIEVYGSSETGVIALRQQAGLWQPMPNSHLGLNEQGALWVENSWISGREQTGDAVHFSDNGFELLGRIDRIIKLGDKRLSLVKMEQDLLAHPAIKDCYIALHIQHQRPLAWIALTAEGIALFQQQGRKMLIQQLRQHLAITQEKFALPRFWRFSNTLPRNSQSKISRSDFIHICTAPENEYF